MYEKLFRSHMKKHEMLNNASVGDLGIERPNVSHHRSQELLEAEDDFLIDVMT